MIFNWYFSFSIHDSRMLAREKQTVTCCSANAALGIGIAVRPRLIPQSHYARWCRPFLSYARLDRNGILIVGIFLHHLDPENQCSVRYPLSSSNIGQALSYHSIWLDSRAVFRHWFNIPKRGWLLQDTDIYQWEKNHTRDIRTRSCRWKTCTNGKIASSKFIILPYFGFGGKVLSSTLWRHLPRNPLFSFCRACQYNGVRQWAVALLAYQS